MAIIGGIPHFQTYPPSSLPSPQFSSGLWTPGLTRHRGGGKCDPATASVGEETQHFELEGSDFL